MSAWTCSRCGELVRGQAQHCVAAGCCLTFASTSAGDAHRFGTFPLGRRCLTVLEMLALGWSQDRHGVWRTPRTDTVAHWAEP